MGRRSLIMVSREYARTFFYSFFKKKTSKSCVCGVLFPFFTFFISANVQKLLSNGMFSYKALHLTLFKTKFGTFTHSNTLHNPVFAKGARSKGPVCQNAPGPFYTHTEKSKIAPNRSNLFIIYLPCQHNSIVVA